MDVEFKLFGNLTVRQFAYVAGTFISALVIYSVLPQIAAIPVIVIVVFIGLALALLKVNDQPFSVWFGNFVRSMFTSQRRVYSKSAKKSKYLAKANPSPPATAKYKQLAEKVRDVKVKGETQSDGSRYVKFDRNVESKEEEVEDIMGSGRKQSLDKYFSNAVDTSLSKYQLKSAGKNLASTKTAEENEELVGKGEVKINSLKSAQQRPLNTDNSKAKSDNSFRPPGNAQPKPKTQSEKAETNDEKVAKDEGERQEQGQQNQAANPAPVAKTEQPVQSNPPEATSDKKVNTAEELTANEDTKKTAQVDQKQQSVIQPQPKSPPPPQPQPAQTKQDTAGLQVMKRLRPNQIAGFVVDKEGQPIAKAQVLIKDAKGMLLRSAYTDFHGKFIVPSPLPSGSYLLEVQAKGYKFPEYQLALKDELVPMYRYIAK
jgi:hypothetical protein